jgi:hypothetical protein
LTQASRRPSSSGRPTCPGVDRPLVSVGIAEPTRRSATALLVGYQPCPEIKQHSLLTFGRIARCEPPGSFWTIRALALRQTIGSSLGDVETSFQIRAFDCKTVLLPRLMVSVVSASRMSRTSRADHPPTWPASPCGRLSRPRTTTGPPSP